jgi:dipeptidase E
MAMAVRRSPYKLGTSDRKARYLRCTQLIRLLLLSSSRTPDNEGFLAHGLPAIAEHLNGCRSVAMIPFAGVTLDWDDYGAAVADALSSLGIELMPVHQDPTAIAHSEAVIVGGGNTFQLASEMHSRKMMAEVRDKVLAGAPYIGWSAGSNLACPGIYTTNDMPIVEPSSFDGLGLIPFQINPHYTDAHPDGHRGETRRMRIKEYLVANPDQTVIGLPEGARLRRMGEALTLEGRDAVLFKHDQAPQALAVDDVSDLLAD